MNLRIGHGYDVHRFAEAGGDARMGNTLRKGLLGHSTPMSSVHAVADSLLGAVLCAI